MKTKLNWDTYSVIKVSLMTTMKIYIFIFSILTFGLNIEPSFSQNEKILISSNAELRVEEVLDVIKRQTTYNFIYRSDLFENVPLIKVKKGEIKVVDLFKKIVNQKRLEVNFGNNGFVFIKKATEKKIKKQKQYSITGKVTDARGVPLPGANILEKDTSNGTMTDFEGNFSLKVTNADAILIVTYIGYTTRQVDLNGQSNLNIVLQESAAELDEVVVVGYGSLNKREITSAIVSIDEEAFNAGNINDSEQLLTGKVPGLTISKVGSSPTGATTIRLRGITSFGANSEPLIVIDGVVGGNLNNLDPNDIKSIDVLKDASAGAIYGTRGSSGVIIVTTKSGGKYGKESFNINTYTVFEEISNYRQTASVSEFLENNGTDYGYRTNWLDEVSRTANTNVINTSYSNSLEKLSYRASINYRDIEGVIKGEDLDVLNSRLNIVQNLFDDRLKLTGIMSFSRTKVNGVYGSALRQATYWNPTAPVYVDNDPSKGYFETYEQAVYNPVAMNAENTQNRQTKDFLINFKADFQVLSGLTLSANYSYQNTNTLNGFFSTSNSLVGGGYGLGVGYDNNGRAERNTYDGEDELYEFTATYKKNLKDLDYTVLLGYSSQEEIDESFYATNTDFITSSVLYNNLGLGQGLYQDGGAIAAMGSSKTESLLVSYFGRLNLTYLKDYNLAMSYRREASSRFGANNRWGDFWAVSASADVAEKFGLDIFGYLKLRVGYGLTGNLPNQRYAYLEILDADSNNLGFVNGSYVPAVEPVSNPNPDLKWEEKGELNIGVDYSILKGKISGSFDYYNRKTSNLLNTIDVPSPPNLYPTSLVNLGKLETKGVEAQLNFKVFDSNDFMWRTGLLFDTNETKLVKFNNLENSEFLTENLGTPGFNNLLTTQVKEGEVIGNIMAPRFAGFNEEGKALVYDSDGGEILANDASFEDFIVAGNGLPDFNLSWTNTIKYKKFDISFLWRGSFGHSIANLAAAKLGHTSKAGMYRYVTEGFFNPQGTDDSVWHTKYVENGSFMKLDNLSIGYNLSLNGYNTILKNIRIYATGNNLIVLSKYSGPNPEPRYTGNTGILAPGYDRLNNYLPTRSISIGLNVNF